jgi:hypothetical protein
MIRRYGGTVTDDYGVRIHYPFDGQVDDQSWLVKAVADHGGALSDIVLTSMAGQTGAGFPDRQSADAFTSQLNATGRWRAQVAD